MRILAIAAVSLFCLAMKAKADRPSPYDRIKIYLAEGNIHKTDSSGHLRNFTADEIRKKAEIVIDLSVTRDWLIHCLRWEDHKTNLKKSERDKALVMIIDLYLKGNTPPDGKHYDTLFCNGRFIFNENGDYIGIENLVEGNPKDFRYKICIPNLDWQMSH